MFGPGIGRPEVMYPDPAWRRFGAGDEEDKERRRRYEEEMRRREAENWRWPYDPPGPRTLLEEQALTSYRAQSRETDNRR